MLLRMEIRLSLYERKLPGKKVQLKRREESEHEKIMDFFFAFTSLKIGIHLDDLFSHTPSSLGYMCKSGLNDTLKNKRMTEKNIPREQENVWR